MTNTFLYDKGSRTGHVGGDLESTQYLEKPKGNLFVVLQKHRRGSQAQPLGVEHENPGALPV